MDQFTRQATTTPYKLYHARITSESPAYGSDTSEPARSTLRKRRADADMRTEQCMPSPGSRSAMAMNKRASTAAGGFGDAGAKRKGSIRNAVRKIFGRRSRDINAESNAPLSSSRHASTHNHHKSEPAATLSAPQEYSELAAYPDDEPARPTFADPYPAPSPSFNRAASPYAVQFPNSVKLKPMDLGKPYITRPPQAQLKRRQTLSSLVAEREAAAIAARIATRESSEEKREFEKSPATKELGRRTSRARKKDRRKSRSTDDLKNMVAGNNEPPRKRSEEIRYWRESFQPDVLRASGFTTRRPAETDDVEELVNSPQQTVPQQEMVEEAEEPTQQPELAHMDNLSMPSRTGTFRSSPPVRHGRGKSGSASLDDSDVDPSSAHGTDMSRDLEDRVAKLEAGLHNFQRSLQKLTADRNRRTVIMGSIATKRSSSDMRTPSLLADTLADPLDPASYESYSYEKTALRPSTSPRRTEPEPQAQSQPQPVSNREQTRMEDPFGPTPQTAPPLKVAVPSTQPENALKLPSPLSSHPPTQPAPVPSSSSTVRNQPQPYTFSSLYQMLADERSARRKLETQLKGLQREISDLHTQVAYPSTLQSARSSYMNAGASSKLQELLRETETSPPGTASPSTNRDSGMSSALEPRQLDPMISRFSVSESEAGTGIGAHDYDELATPYEAYRTPREERSAYSLASRTDDSETF